MNIPQLRFPEFKDEWEMKRIGDIGDVKMCKRIFNEETQPFGEIPFFKIGSFGKEPDAFISKELYNDYKKRFSFPKKGDILISAAGTIGRTVVYDGQDAYYQDSNIVWIENNNETVSNEFLYYIYQIVKFNTEGGTIQRLYNNILRSTEFYKPTLPEQTKIASFLTAVDEKIQALKKKHNLLEQYKKGVLQKLFSQELRFKDEDGEEFPDWEEKQVKDLFKVTRGDVLAMSLVSDEIENDHIYPVYSSQTKNRGLAGYYNEYLFEDAITWTTDGAGAGDVNFREGKFYCTNVCGVLLSDEGYANLFIAELLNSVSRKYVSYVGNPKLMNNVMAEISIIIPVSVEKQQRISNFLKSLNVRIKQLEIEIFNIENWKKGLLQIMFC